MPSNVPSFKVSSLGDCHVTLQWEPVPILQQYGLMQYYEIGVAGQNSTYNGTYKPCNKPAVKIVSVFVCPLVSRDFIDACSGKGINSNQIHFKNFLYNTCCCFVTLLWTISPSSVQFERITTGSVPDFLIRGPQSRAGVRRVDKSCKCGWSRRKHHQKVYHKGQWTLWYKNFAVFLM